MNTFSLACRNLLRNGRRSAATLMAMGIGMTAVLVFGAYATNIILSLQTAVIKRSGHLQIQRKGYYLDGSSNPYSYGIADYARIIERLSQDLALSPMLSVVTPSLEFAALAGNSNAGASRSVLASGIVAAERNRLSSWNAYGIVDQAEPLRLEGTPRDSVIIGHGVARKLRLCERLRVSGCRQSVAVVPNDGIDAPQNVLALSALEETGPDQRDGTRIELMAANVRGAPNVVSLDVLSTRNVGIKEWDDVYFVMHLEQAQRLLFGKAAPQVTAILVQLNQTSQLAAGRERVLAVLAELNADTALEVLDHETLNPMYGQSVRFMVSIFAFMAVLIGTIVVFTVANTMSTAVTERTVEIGTLRSVGLRRSGVRRMFVAEGLVLGLVGVVVGTSTAFIASILINHSGLSWTPPGHVASHLIQIDILSNLPLLAGSALCMVAVAAFSAWWPATRAARLGIVDALRHV